MTQRRNVLGNRMLHILGCNCNFSCSVSAMSLPEAQHQHPLLNTCGLHRPKKALTL